MNHEIHEAHEKAKTLADVLAEMRIFRCRDLSTGKLKVCNAIANYFADRIEAAWKRERAEIEADALSVGGVVEAARNKPSGDAAAMREAALPCFAFAEWLLENAGKDALGAAIRDNGPIIRQKLEELRAALSAPPRNCERFKTKEEAAIAFAKETKQWIPQQVLWGLAPWLDWLFATATKGETDGSK